MTSINVSIIWLCLTHYLLITKSTEFNCTWSHGNASFNLCKWQKTNNEQGNGYWEVYDGRDSSLNNYTYHFNICGDVTNKNNLNNLCTNNTARQINNIPTGYCTDIVNTTNECKCVKTSKNKTNCIEESIHTININTAAYQMPRKQSSNYCYRLHDGITPPIFSLINNNDPTVGVSIKYIGGDWCPEYGKNREFIINFNCEDNYEKIGPDMDEKISEPSNEGINGCIYILEIDSTIGCPIQCEIINDKLCSGNGICEYDETNMLPKCFCFSGWYGESCNLDYDSPTHIELKHNDGKYIILLIIIVGFMTFLMFVIMYLICRVQKKNKYDINAYIDEDIEESIQNTTTIQQNKQLKGSKLAEQLVHSGGDNDETAHPIVV